MPSLLKDLAAAPGITGLLLAAGSSQRFGGNKLLQLLPDGTPIAVSAAKNLLAALPNVTAIVRPGDRDLSVLFHDLGLSVLECADAHAGMGRSLACGVRAHPHAHGWIIALADMPYIEAETIRKLAAALDAGASLTAPFYQGERGHPVGFGKEFFEDLIGLQGDKGAQDMLRSQADRLCRLACNDPGILRDIDVPSDIGLQDRLTDQACIALTATSDRTLEDNGDIGDTNKLKKAIREGGR